MNFKIVRIDYKYCDYLRKFDNKVIYNMGEKELRPFLGVLFNIEKFEYFAPLSSPKKKHKNMKNILDFFKIKNGELGVINFNNMIPVTSKNYLLINLNSDKLDSNIDKKYKKMLREQLIWLNKNNIQVRKKSNMLYELYTNGKLPLNIIKRCCNFKLLEEKCIEYNR